MGHAPQAAGLASAAGNTRGNDRPIAGPVEAHQTRKYLILLQMHALPSQAAHVAIGGARAARPRAAGLSLYVSPSVSALHAQLIRPSTRACAPRSGPRHDTATQAPHSPHEACLPAVGCRSARGRGAAQQKSAPPGAKTPSWHPVTCRTPHPLVGRVALYFYACSELQERGRAADATVVPQRPSARW